MEKEVFTEEEKRSLEEELLELENLDELERRIDSRPIITIGDIIAKYDSSWAANGISLK